MIEEIKNYTLNKLHEGSVKVHITKIDFPENKKYDTVLGIWVDGEFDKTFELENITNKEIDEFIVELNNHIHKNTLYLI